MRSRESFVELYGTTLAGYYQQLYTAAMPSNVLRMARIFELAGDLAGKVVLDLGCAVGAVAIEARRRGARSVVAIDFTPAMIEHAERNARDRGIDAISFVVGDVSEMSFEPASFDVIIAADIVEHLYPRLLTDTMRRAYRALRPGGRLVVHTTPTRYTYLFTIGPVMLGMVPFAVLPGKWQDRLVELYYRTLVQWVHLAVKGRTYDRALEDRPHCNPQTSAELVALLTRTGFRVHFAELEELASDCDHFAYRMARRLFRRCSHLRGHLFVAASKPLR